MGLSMSWHGHKRVNIFPHLFSCFTQQLILQHTETINLRYFLQHQNHTLQQRIEKVYQDTLSKKFFFGDVYHPFPGPKTENATGLVGYTYSFEAKHTHTHTKNSKTRTIKHSVRKNNKI